MSIIYNQMMAARQKYGKQIDYQSLYKLRQEFGEDVFPTWTSRFDGWEKPRKKIPYNYMEMELWEITECFCRRGQPLGYEKFLTESEKSYFRQFSDAFRYDLNTIQI
jgi:hypothetical protein